MKSKINKIINTILLGILLLTAITIFAVSLYIKNVFGNAQFEQLLFSLQFAEGTSNDVIIDGVKYCLPIIIILSIVLIIPVIIRLKKNTFLKINIKKKELKFQLFPLNHRIIYTLIVFLLLTIYSFDSIGFFDYLIKQNQSSHLFEDYYINPDEVKITFPEEKQNLIYIYLESMESSYSTSMINDEEVNLIPNLEEIAQTNLNFSNTENLGGAYNLNGTEWTIAAIVAQTAGIPLKLAINGNTYDHYPSFLPGVTSLGDILESEGYNQYFLIGSMASFAGRDIYFTEHGDYELLDYNWAKEQEKINEDYYVFWGYEDNKLFEFAKEQLLEISQNDEPFNFTMLTVDTHALDGYLDETCEATYDYTYANVISCSDSMISEFVEWIEEQDFYENTTIILTGDHITMQSDIADYLIDDTRTIYNAFINAQTTPKNSTNRIFNPTDMFPTTLAALGITIEGNRLGLGTNLFSNAKTLSEELGLDYLNEEISKNSDYYNKYFLKETYYEMLIEEKEEE